MVHANTKPSNRKRPTQVAKLLAMASDAGLSLTTGAEVAGNVQGLGQIKQPPLKTIRPRPMVEPSKVAPHVLAFIALHPRFTPKELCRYVRKRVGIVPGGASQTLSRLKKQGRVRYTYHGGFYQAEVVK